jgi:Ca2+:H+ antiporter
LLTLAVTIIEVALIATIMPGEKEVPTLARDTVFAVVMIVCNGLVGIHLHRRTSLPRAGFPGQRRKPLSERAVHAATITRVLPNYTLTAPGPIYSAVQLGFVSDVTILLDGVFLYIQTIRHRDYFIRETAGLTGDGMRVSSRTLALGVGLLLVSLLAVVLLAKKFSLVVDAGTALLGAPPAFAGVLVALLILLPESVAAIAAARGNDLQKSINLALGSSLATIGLTIPAVAALSIAIGQPLDLGLGTKDEILLSLTLLLGVITLGTGRTTILQGIVHLVIFAAFLFFAVVP